MFTIKKASEIMGISSHSLRFYDKEGLLPTLSRTESGRRTFSYEDLEWVYTIQCLRATGMPLSEIKRYIQLVREGDETIDERHQIILEQRKKAEEEVRAAKDRLKLLDRKVKWHQAIMRGEDANAWRLNMRALVDKALAKMDNKTQA